MYCVKKWGNLFHMDHHERFLDYSRHPFENTPYYIDEIKSDDKLVLAMLGVIEEECDEYIAILSDSTMQRIRKKVAMNNERCKIVIVRHGKTSITLGWKLPEDKQLLDEQLEKDWGSVTINGERKIPGSLEFTYVDYRDVTTTCSEIRLQLSNGSWLSLDPDDVEFVEKESACFDESRGTGFYSNFFESREDSPYLVAVVSKAVDGYCVEELKDERLVGFKDWIRQKSF